VVLLFCLWRGRQVLSEAPLHHYHGQGTARRGFQTLPQKGIFFSVISRSHLCGVVVVVVTLSLSLSLSLSVCLLFACRLDPRSAEHPGASAG
jgi:hypothetical protein